MPNMKYDLGRISDLHIKNNKFKLSYKYCLFALLFSANICNAEIYFNPRFISNNPDSVADLSVFESGQEVPPGNYTVDLYVNDNFIMTHDIMFAPSHRDGMGLTPCLTSDLLIKMGVSKASILGVKIDENPENKNSEIDNTDSLDISDSCISLTERFGESTTHFDVSLQRLDISIPQIYMNNYARGYISPEFWDEGINAGFINYSFTGNKTKSDNSGNSNYAFLNLHSGVNLGAWRLRDDMAWSYSSGSSSASMNKWQHINTWLERGISSLRSRLTLGDSYTDSDIFDGINFRGIRLASDENMLPDSERGFAPVIRGIAKGTAQVIINQNGYEIYQTTVPPGPFTINDLYAAGNGGDLQVTIKESDGTVQTISIPYSSVPMLQRQGHTKYTITAAEYRSGHSQQEKPKFFQSTIIHGLSRGWTLYGGLLASERYKGLNLGVGKDMGLYGALSLDITQANSKLPDDSHHQGQSIRFLYSKSINELGTNFSLVGYRYSTQGYYTLAETSYAHMKGYQVETENGPVEVKPTFTDYYNLNYNKRGKIQVSVTQQLGRSATLYFTGSRQSYWGKNKVDDQLQAGLSTVIEDISLSVSYSLSKNAFYQGKDQLIAANISIPFSHWMRSDSSSIWRNTRASYSMSNDANGQMTNLVGLNGTFLDEQNLSYSVQTGYTGGGDSNNGNSSYATANYRGGYGTANVGYSRNNNTDQFYYGLSGGVLAHENGITLSQPLNDTMVLVKAPGADNVRVENQTGVSTDWRGYAVLPYANEYKENRIALNTNTLKNNVDLDDAVVSVIPTHGAIVRADFKAHVGAKMLLTLTMNGKPVPFGALVTANDNRITSIVADNGQVYLSGMPPTGEIQAKWGATPDSHCVATYHLAEGSEKIDINILSATCR